MRREDGLEKKNIFSIQSTHTSLFLCSAHSANENRERPVRQANSGCIDMTRPERTRTIKFFLPVFSSSHSASTASFLSPGRVCCRVAGRLWRMAKGFFRDDVGCVIQMIRGRLDHYCQVSETVHNNPLIITDPTHQSNQVVWHPPRSPIFLLM